MYETLAIGQPTNIAKGWRRDAILSQLHLGLFVFTISHAQRNKKSTPSNPVHTARFVSSVSMAFFFF